MVNNCDVCKKYKKLSPNPVVGLPRATDFNQTVAIDLHYVDKNLWHFYIIDEFSQYSNAVIIRSKHLNIVIKNFLKNWINIFGSLTKYLVIMGGGDLFQKNLQISVKTLV